MQLTASHHYPAEVYPQIQPLFTRNSTLLHLIHLLFTFDVRKRAPSGIECNSTHIPNGARIQQSPRRGGSPPPAVIRGNRGLTSPRRRLLQTCRIYSATYRSATSSARSRAASPKRTSSSGVLSGGTTWIRLKFANGSTPSALSAAMTSFISGELPP